MKKKKRKSTKGILRGPLKQDKSSKARRSRNKGHDYERDIATFYRELGFKDVKRTLQSRAGYEGSDVQGTPWWVECKHHAKVGKVARWWVKALEDTHQECGAGAEPSKPIVLHVKKTNGPEFVVISKDHWEQLVRSSSCGSSSGGQSHPNPSGPRLPGRTSR